MKHKRTLYLSRLGFASSQTNVYNTTKTCEAMRDAGADVTLVSTDTPPEREEFFSRYRVEEPFTLIGLGIPRKRTGRIGRMLWSARTNAALALFVIRNRGQYDVVYFRDEGLVVAVFVARLFGLSVVFEIHAVLVGWHRQVFNRLAVFLADAHVAISKRLAQYYERIGVPMLVSYCGADESFWIDVTKDMSELRRTLDLPLNKRIIGYAGVLGKNPNDDVYEVDDVIRALVELPEDVMVIAVGERGNDAAWLRDVARENGVAERVVILPWQERNQIPKYLQSFDIIAVPRRKKDMASDSPLKMFSALSVGNPIVAGRSESITEVLVDGENALIVEENSPKGWAQAIRWILEDKELAERLSGHARESSKQYTWEKRGRYIIRFIEEYV